MRLPGKLFTLLVAVFFSVTLAHAQSFSFAAIGDVPYGPVEDLARLADKLNQAPIVLTIHVGDIKSGATLCTDQTFLDVKAQFDRFQRPLIYTPGDNEWTDCHRFSNGSYDPLERLEKLRSIFFSTNTSMGQQTISLQLQSAAPSYRRFVENRRWHVGPISFATLHQVGSNNNLQPELASSVEFKERNAANIAWMRDTFSSAKARNDVAVVLAMQADTFFGSAGKPDSGYAGWLTALNEEVRAWNKPVLLIQGDTHNFTIDHPLKGADGKPLDSVTRVIVHGALDVNATLIDFHPDKPHSPFTIRPLFK